VVVVTVGAVVAPVPPQAANMTASAVNAMRAVIRRVIRGTPCDRSSGRDHTALYDGRWRSGFTAHGMHRLRIVDGGEVD
jgi:hypothetical protein